MESKTTITTKIWLNGSPPFSLNYKDNEGKEVYMDLTPFRPNPADYLRKGPKYKATLELVLENNYKGDDIWVVRKILAKDRKFVNIR